MLFKSKRESSKEALLKAYEEYMKARKVFVQETGWNIESQQVIESTAEYAKERDEFVKALTEIDKKYNTTK